MGRAKKKPAELRHSETLPSLFRICIAMGSTLDLGKLLDLILRLTMEELRAQQGSILLLDKESDTLKMLAARGLPREITQQGYIPRKGSIAEWVIENDRPLLLNDVRDDDPRFTSIAKKRRIRSSLCVPLRAKGDVIGTINISRTQPEPFSEKDLEKLVILAAQAAVSIENARLHEENIRAERLAAIGQTVAAISHCIKNILTGLKGGVAIIEMGREQKSWDLVEQGWEMIKRNTDRIALVVLDMLEYSKERTPTRESFDLRRLVDDVFAAVSYQAEREGIKLTSNIPAECGTLYADFTQIYRAILNLVTNALDALHEAQTKGGEIEISAERAGPDSPAVRHCIRRPKGEFCLIHVRDTGPGISPEHLPNIFQPFFSSKGSKGTGLGLAVTRKIAREHGGDVMAESQPGKGTTFTMVLPIAAPGEKNGGKRRNRQG